MRRLDRITQRDGAPCVNEPANIHVRFVVLGTCGLERLDRDGYRPDFVELGETGFHAGFQKVSTHQSTAEGMERRYPCLPDPATGFARDALVDHLAHALRDLVGGLLREGDRQHLVHGCGCPGCCGRERECGGKPVSKHSGLA